MQVLILKKKYVINTMLIMILFASAIYAGSMKKDIIGVFLNNSEDIPICSVDVPDKRIALTFDVIWGDKEVQEIAAVLKRYNIKATFFLAGTLVDRNPDIAKSICAGNNEIGNHSASHIKMTGLSKKEIVKEVRNAEIAIVRATGIKPVLFRAPYGEYDSKLVSTVKSMEYNTVQWDVDSLDWRSNNPDEIFNNVTNKAAPGSIILFHTNNQNTLRALPEIIEKLRKEGYKFLTVSEMLLKDNYYVDNTGRQKQIIR